MAYHCTKSTARKANNALVVVYKLVIDVYMLIALAHT